MPDKQIMMTIDEAKAFLQDDNAAFPQWCEATAVICESATATYEDYLICLTRRGIPAEMAACTLYTKTKRPRSDDTIHSIVLDPKDWIRYLKKEKLMP